MLVYLYGASGHAKVIIDTLRITGAKIGGLIDANPAIGELQGYPVHMKLPEDVSTASFIITIGNNAIRKRISGELARSFYTAVHPAANISQSATISEGSVVMAGVCVNSGAVIGKHVILNTNCSVDHDCIVEDFVHISPNAALAGDVHVGEGTHIGIGACVIQGIKIGKWCTIGAGSVIIRDVPDYCTVVGIPGRIIKRSGKAG